MATIKSIQICRWINFYRIVGCPLYRISTSEPSSIVNFVMNALTNFSMYYLIIWGDIFHFKIYMTLLSLKPFLVVLIYMFFNFSILALFIITFAYYGKYGWKIAKLLDSKILQRSMTDSNIRLFQYCKLVYFIIRFLSQYYSIVILFIHGNFTFDSFVKLIVCLTMVLIEGVAVEIVFYQQYATQLALYDIKQSIKNGSAINQVPLERYTIEQIKLLAFANEQLNQLNSLPMGMYFLTNILNFIIIVFFSLHSIGQRSPMWVMLLNPLNIGFLICLMVMMNQRTRKRFNFIYKMLIKNYTNSTYYNRPSIRNNLKLNYKSKLIRLKELDNYERSFQFTIFDIAQLDLRYVLEIGMFALNTIVFLTQTL